MGIAKGPIWDIGACPGRSPVGCRCDDRHRTYHLGRGKIGIMGAWIGNFDRHGGEIDWKNRNIVTAHTKQLRHIRHIGH